MTGANVAGWLFAALPASFTCGMIITDALNGLWVSHWFAPRTRVRRASRHEPRDRLPAGVAALAAARRGPRPDAQAGQWSTALGVGVIA